jgi:microcystin-dependent protein
MSELRVDTLKPALNPSKITITPGVVVEDTTGVEQFAVTSSGEIKVMGPLRVGSSVSNTPGSSSQVLTSQGTGLPPVWAEGFPIGGIIIWYGNSSAIPTGWALCNGDKVNGFTTPDLRDRFVVGAGGSYNINQNGGSKDAVVVAHTHTVTDPGHTHRLPTDSNGTVNQQSLTPTANSDEAFLQPTESSKTGITIASAGESGTGKNLPPYYALCYIMRVPTS